MSIEDEIYRRDQNEPEPKRGLRVAAVVAGEGAPDSERRCDDRHSHHSCNPAAMHSSPTTIRYDAIHCRAYIHSAGHEE